MCVTLTLIFLLFLFRVHLHISTNNATIKETSNEGNVLIFLVEMEKIAILGSQVNTSIVSNSFKPKLKK